MEALIQLSEVTKRYVAGGAPALDRVSLQVAAGEAVAVMGPSGQREVHAAEPGRRARQAFEWHRHRGRAADRHAVGDQDWPATGAPRWG